MLTLSLVVQKSNIRDFVLFASELLSNTRAEAYMVLDHIRARPAQPRLSFSDMRKLFALLSSTKNEEMIKKQQEQLKEYAVV